MPIKQITRFWNKGEQRTIILHEETLSLSKSILHFSYTQPIFNLHEETVNNYEIHALFLSAYFGDCGPWTYQYDPLSRFHCNFFLEFIPYWRLDFFVLSSGVVGREGILESGNWPFVSSHIITSPHERWCFHAYHGRNRQCSTNIEPEMNNCTDDKDVARGGVLRCTGGLMWKVQNRFVKRHSNWNKFIKAEGPNQSYVVWF